MADTAGSGIPADRRVKMKNESTEPPPPRKRLGWLRREGIDLGDAVVQFIAVLLGVLFALLISQWNDHRQQQAQARAAMLQRQATINEAMHAIRAELASNRNALHASVTQLYAMAKAMADSPANQKQAPRFCYEWNGWNGRIAVVLTDSAYQTAIATQALGHMPFREAHQVAQVYGAQNLLKTGFDLVRNRILFSNPQPLGTCISGIESLGVSEGMTDKVYSALIGADPTAWPQPPVGSMPPTAKQGSPRLPADRAATHRHSG